MKKFLLLSIICGCSFASQAQAKLQFCLDVDKAKGTALMSSDQFVIDPDGNSLMFFVSNTDGFGGEKLNFKIYRINEGKEELDSEMSQSVGTSWTYAWKEIIFYDPAIYVVKVYNTAGQQIAKSTAKIMLRNA